MENREHKPNESFRSARSSEDSRNDKVNIEASNSVEHKEKQSSRGVL